MSVAYRLRGVRHCYDERCVLDIPDLEIQDGEILAVVGPSGAGKSTLLRLLNLLEAPTEGRLTYHGQEVGPEAPLDLRREVVTVFQRSILLRRSVTANLRYGRRVRSADLDDAGVDSWLSRLGLAELRHAPARTLSAGEAQRVALARAMVTDPSVLLLDEPTGNLDPYNVGLIEEIVRADNAERGTTTVLVTHDVFQARRLAHRTGLLIGGGIVEVAETERFFTNPQHPLTAAFSSGRLVNGSAPHPSPSSRPRQRRWRRPPATR